jgi:hypothetical protein
LDGYEQLMPSVCDGRTFIYYLPMKLLPIKCHQELELFVCSSFTKQNRNNINEMISSSRSALALAFRSINGLNPSAKKSERALMRTTYRGRSPMVVTLFPPQIPLSVPHAHEDPRGSCLDHGMPGNTIADAFLSYHLYQHSDHTHCSRK